jgi:hypothetical protein
MANFIKLTSVLDIEIYMNPDHIVCFGIDPETGATAISTTTGDTGIYPVQESPGYILNLVRQFTNK